MHFLSKPHHFHRSLFRRSSLFFSFFFSFVRGKEGEEVAFIITSPEFEQVDRIRMYVHVQYIYTSWPVSSFGMSEREREIQIYNFFLHSIFFCLKHKQPTFSPDKTKDKRSFALVWSPLIVPPKKPPPKKTPLTGGLYLWLARWLAAADALLGGGNKGVAMGSAWESTLTARKEKKKKRREIVIFHFPCSFFSFSYITFIILFFIKYNFFLTPLFYGESSILSMYVVIMIITLW